MENICRFLGGSSPARTEPRVSDTQFLRLFTCLLLKKGFYIGDGLGHAVGWQALQEGLAVSLSPDSGVEEDQDTAVFQRADEAAEALFEGEHGSGDLVVEEGLAARFFDGLHARRNDRVAGHGEGQLVDNDAAEGFALDVYALPEARGAEEDGVGRGPELFQKGVARGCAMQQQGEIEHGQKALVEVAHLAITCI